MAEKKYLHRTCFLRFPAGLCGGGTGALVSIFAKTLIADMLFKVAGLDYIVFLLAAIVLILVSILAALAPALRAAKIEPMTALRGYPH